MFHALQLHRRKPDRIRPERGSCRKHTDPFVSAEPRRPYHRRPGIPHRLRKFPDQPEMGIFLDPAERIRIPELRFKDDGAFQFLNQPALPRNPEFFREIRVNPGDHFHCNFFCHVSFSSSRFPYALSYHFARKKSTAPAADVENLLKDSVKRGILFSFFRIPLLFYAPNSRMLFKSSAICSVIFIHSSLSATSFPLATDCGSHLIRDVSRHRLTISNPPGTARFQVPRRFATPFYLLMCILSHLLSNCEHIFCISCIISCILLFLTVFLPI